MIKKCQERRINCQIAKIDSRYKPIWIRYGYAYGTVAKDFKNIFIGYHKIESVSLRLAGVSLGSQTSDIGKPITLSANDFYAEISRSILDIDELRENIIYYAIQKKYKGENDTGFLDSNGNIEGKLYRVIYVEDKNQTYYRVYLRELESMPLKAGQIKQGQLK